MILIKAFDMYKKYRIIWNSQIYIDQPIYNRHKKDYNKTLNLDQKYIIFKINLLLKIPNAFYT